MLSALFSAAGCAKKELMKDKMKAHLDAKVGKKMDEAADLITNLYLEKMETMMDCGEKKSEAEEQLMKIFKS